MTGIETGGGSPATSSDHVKEQLEAVEAGPLANDLAKDTPEQGAASSGVLKPQVGESHDQWMARVAQEQAASDTPDSDSFPRMATPNGPVAPTGEPAPVLTSEPTSSEVLSRDIKVGEELVQQKTGRHFKVQRVIDGRGGKRIAQLVYGEGDTREKIDRRVDRLLEQLDTEDSGWSRVEAEPASEQASEVSPDAATSTPSSERQPEDPSLLVDDAPLSGPETNEGQPEPQSSARMPERPALSASDEPAVVAEGISPGEVFEPAEPAAADTSPPEQQDSAEISDEAFEAAVDRIERSDTATFAGRTYARGEIVSYTSSTGHSADYVVLCNTFGDPPGLALQAVNNEALVFRVAGDVDPARVSPPPPGPPGPPEVEPPVDPPPSPGPPGPPEVEPPVDPPPPPGPPGPPEVEPPVDPPPPPPGEGEPTPEPMPDIPTSAAGLEDAIQRLAKAKDRRESIFSRFHKDRDGRDDQAELEAAADNLKQVFAQHVETVARAVKSRNDVARADMTRVQTEYHTRLTAGEDAASPEMVALAQQYQDAKVGIGQLEVENTLLIVQEMAAARYRVDQSQLEIKKSKPGGKFIGKFREWWTKHPAMRAGIGGALTVGALATGAFVPPLALGFLGAKRLFGTVGTYMGVEGAGRAITNKRSERKDATAARRGLSDLQDRQGESAVVEANRLATERASASPEEEREYVERFIQENYQDILIEADGLRAALSRGAEASPGAVVDKLIGRSLEQLKSDVTWTRRSKYLAATGALLVNSVAIYHWADKIKNPFGGGSGGGEAGTKLNEAFLRGAMNQQKARGPINWAALTEHGPGQQQRADAMFNNSAAKDWVKAVKALPQANQEKAAEAIGFQNSAGTLNPVSLNQIIVSNSTVNPLGV